MDDVTRGAPPLATSLIGSTGVTFGWHSFSGSELSYWVHKISMQSLQLIHSSLVGKI